MLEFVGSSVLDAAAAPSGEKADSVRDTVVPVPAPDPEEGIAVVSSVSASCIDARFSHARDPGVMSGLWDVRSGYAACGGPFLLFAQ